jgi:hypothetical protein
MRDTVRNLLHYFPVLVLLTVPACSSSPEPVAVHPVSGQVLYDGKPAAGVKVFLYPTSAPTVPTIPTNPYGVTGADGRFTLSTYGNGDGAAEGGYQVILFWPPEIQEDEEEPDTDRLLGWYTAVHSKLSVEIRPGPNTLEPFKLPARTKPPEAAEGIPGRN